MRRQWATGWAATGLLALLLGGGGYARGQAVDVTVSLDHPDLLVGLTTTCRVYATIKPAYSNRSEQVFSWYVDLLNSSGATGSVDGSKLTMATGDNYANLSSSGTASGAQRRGIRNTFMNRPGAGKHARVELFNVPVTALAPGVVTFSVQAGTTATNMAHDFIVATTNQPEPFTGGDYAAAHASLTVHAAPRLAIRTVGNRVQVHYPVWPNLDYRVESRGGLLAGPDWSPLPGAPHNAGLLTDTNAALRRVYRLAVRPW